MPVFWIGEPVYQRKHGSGEWRRRWMDRFVAKLENDLPVDVRVPLYLFAAGPLYTGQRRVWCVYNGGTNSLSRAPPTPLSPARLVNGGWMDRMWLLHSPALKWAARNTTLCSYRLISPLIGLSLRFFILLNVDLIMGEKVKRGFSPGTTPRPSFLSLSSPPPLPPLSLCHAN